MTPRLMLVIPSATSFEAFLLDVAAAWLRSHESLAVAVGPRLAGCPPRVWPDGVERFDLPSFRGAGPAGLLRAAAVIRAAVARWRPTIVHAHFAAAALAAAFAKRSLPLADRNWLATLHGLHPRTTVAGLVSPASLAESFIVRSMTATWVVNPEDLATLRTRLPDANVRRHESATFGCDLERFEAGRFPPAKRHELRAALGIPAASDVVAFVGRKTSFKGFATAVRVVWALRAGGTPVHLLVVGGDDPLHDSGLSAAEQARYRGDPGITDVGWQTDVAAHLSLARLALLPGIREGLPVAAMEALALGIPVVTTASRGCRDVVRDGIDGITAADGSVSTVAACVRSLLADPEALARMAAAAVDGRHRFDRRAFVAEQLAIYESFAPAGTADAHA